MSKNIIILGTDTDIGKTFISALLCRKFKLSYFKPIQCGQPKDRDYIEKFSPKTPIINSHFEFTHPMSPDQASKLESKKIHLDQLPAPTENSILIELAGGLMVPLNPRKTQLDLLKKWHPPCLLVTSSRLGTLNHTLMTAKILQDNHIACRGLILNGPPHPENTQSLKEHSPFPIIEHIPWLPEMNLESAGKWCDDWKPSQALKKIFNE